MRSSLEFTRARWSSLQFTGAHWSSLEFIASSVMVWPARAQQKVLRQQRSTGGVREQWSAVLAIGLHEEHSEN